LNYQIKISRYPVAMRLGIFPSEQVRNRPVLFTIILDVKSDAKLAAEDLDRTIDYAAVAKTIDDLLIGKGIGLAETVADMVGATLLAQFPRVVGLSVEIHKISLPKQLTRGAEFSVKREFVRNGKA